MFTHLLSTLALGVGLLAAPAGAQAPRSILSTDGRDARGVENTGPSNEAQPAETMRATIVGKEGDEFIAETEEGQELRLPVDGAPADVGIGDELRLVADFETQTIYIFKATPDEAGEKATEL
ncbi:hypothetical protein [Candidatus Nitrospira bockiana]